MKFCAAHPDLNPTEDITTSFLVVLDLPVPVHMSVPRTEDGRQKVKYQFGPTSDPKLQDLLPPAYRHHPHYSSNTVVLPM